MIWLKNTLHKQHLISGLLAPYYWRFSFINALNFLPFNINSIKLNTIKQTANNNPTDALFKKSVAAEEDQQCLLDFLLPCIPYLSLDEWQRLLDQGLVCIDGNVAAGNPVLAHGQVVTYEVPGYKEGEVDCNWKLLWQNHEIAAVHKPGNLPVSRTTRNVYNTLVQILRRESPWPDAHLLHRLDLETSGIVLIGQNNDVAKTYQPILKELMQKKVYLAIVHGEPVWRTLDYQCELNTLKQSDIRCQMHKVDEGSGKPSQTIFTVLKSSNGFSLIQAQLITGRKHQIRAHLSELGHAIVGDKIYSNGGEFYLKRLDDALTQEDHDGLLTKHHLLHAYQVEIKLNNDETHIIKDENFSDEWQRFSKLQGLS